MNCRMQCHKKICCYPINLRVTTTTNNPPCLDGSFRLHYNPRTVPLIRALAKYELTVSN